MIDSNVLPKAYTTNINKLNRFLANNPMVMTQLLRLLGEQGLGSKKKVVGSDEYTFGPDWIPTSLGQRKKMKRIHKKLNRSVREIAVRKKPKKFKDIYNALPSDLKKRVYNLKNYDQRRDAHPEGNVLKHTIAVTNRALKTYR